MNDSESNNEATDLKRREMLKKLAAMSAYTAPTVTVLLASSAQGHSRASGAFENYATIGSCATDPTSMNAMGSMNHPDFMNPPNHCNSRHGPF